MAFSVMFSAYMLTAVITTEASTSHDRWPVSEKVRRGSNARTLSCEAAHASFVNERPGERGAVGGEIVSLGFVDVPTAVSTSLSNKTA